MTEKPYEFEGVIPDGVTLPDLDPIGRLAPEADADEVDTPPLDDEVA